MHQFSTQWVTQFGIESEIWSLETRDECIRMSLENFKHLMTYWCNIVKSKQFSMHLKDPFQTMQCHCHNIHTRGWKCLYLSYTSCLGHYPKSATFLVRIFQELHCHPGALSVWRTRLTQVRTPYYGSVLPQPRSILQNQDYPLWSFTFYHRIFDFCQERDLMNNFCIKRKADDSLWVLMQIPVGTLYTNCWIKKGSKDLPGLFKNPVLQDGPRSKYGCEAAAVSICVRSLKRFLGKL